MLDRLGATASDTIIIGDSDVNIQAGRKLGCKTCLFAPNENALFHSFDHIRREKPNFEVNSLRAFADLLT